MGYSSSADVYISRSPGWQSSASHMASSVWKRRPFTLPATGAVRADVRRVRENGGLYTLRTADDLPQELNAAVASLVTAP